MTMNTTAEGLSLTKTPILVPLVEGQRDYFPSGESPSFSSPLWVSGKHTCKFAVMHFSTPKSSFPLDQTSKLK